MNLIQTVREHQADRAEHRRLRRELSSYSTPSQIDDLLAAVDRDDDGTASEVREILQLNLREYYQRRWPVAG
jgi:hypothetical protein